MSNEYNHNVIIEKSNKCILLAYGKFGISYHIVDKNKIKEFASETENIIDEITVCDYIGIHENDEDIIYEYAYQERHGVPNSNFIPVQQIVNYDIK